MPTKANITELLQAYQAGDASAFDSLLAQVYRELRVVARNRVAGQVKKCSLSPTDLLHETFMRLRAQEGLALKDRQHFFAVAAQCMRWVLIDYAKAKGRAKRGGAAIRVTLDEGLLASRSSEIEASDLGHVLEKLAAQDPRACQIVELRVFSGMTLNEVADDLRLSLATVKRDWKMAIAFLRRELEAPPTPARSYRKAG